MGRAKGKTKSKKGGKGPVEWPSKKPAYVIRERWPGQLSKTAVSSVRNVGLMYTKRLLSKAKELAGDNKVINAQHLQRVLETDFICSALINNKRIAGVRRYTTERLRKTKQKTKKTDVEDLQQSQESVVSEEEEEEEEEEVYEEEEEEEEVEMEVEAETNN